MARLTEGRTSVIIAHRLSTIQKADRILVLHRGAVRERGAHARAAARGAASTRGCTSCSSTGRAVTVGRGSERRRRAVSARRLPPGGAIPRGRVATYGQIAALLGWPRAARAVGDAMRHCPDGLPWHRVVNAQRRHQPARQCRQHADAADPARAGRRAGAPRARPARPAPLDGTTEVTAARARGARAGSDREASMRLGLNLGYSGSSLGHRPHDGPGGGPPRLPLGVVGRGLRLRRGDAARVDRRAHHAHPGRHRDHADPRAHADADGDDGDDARSALRRPLPPRARASPGPRWSRAGTASPFGKPLARTREYVEIVRAVWRREKAARVPGEYYQIPYAGADATGLGKPLRSILHGRADMPIYLAAIGPKNVALAAEIADGLDARLLLARAHVGVPRVARRRASAPPAAASRSRAFDVMPTVPVVVGRRRAGLPRRDEAAAGALRGRHGRARPELLQRHRAALRLRGRRRRRSRTSTCRARRQEAAAAVPDALVDEVALCGPRERIRERLAALEGLGRHHADLRDDRGGRGADDGRAGAREARRRARAVRHRRARPRAARSSSSRSTRARRSRRPTRSGSRSRQIAKSLVFTVNGAPADGGRLGGEPRGRGQAGAARRRQGAPRRLPTP